MHGLILGITESGKSTLAKILSFQFRKKREVIVLDPMYGKGWGSTVTIRSVGDLAAEMKKRKNCYVFADESGTWIERDGSHDWITTHSRHYGHSVFLVSQRGPTQITVTMREQSNRLFLFTSSRGDSLVHAEEWNQPVLANAHTLPRLHFYQTDRYGNVMLKRITNDYKRVELVEDFSKKSSKPLDSEPSER